MQTMGLSNLSQGPFTGLQMCRFFAAGRVCRTQWARYNLDDIGLKTGGRGDVEYV
jgi:hypothetical protein